MEPRGPEDPRHAGGPDPPRVQAGAVPGPQPREERAAAATAAADTEAVKSAVREVMAEILDKRDKPKAKSGG